MDSHFLHEEEGAKNQCQLRVPLLPGEGNPGYRSHCCSEDVQCSQADGKSWPSVVFQIQLLEQLSTWRNVQFK